MAMRFGLLKTAVVLVALNSPALAGATEKADAPKGALPEDVLSDDAILLQMLASRDYCKKRDTAHAAEYDKAIAALTPADEDKAALKSFLAKPDSAASVAKRAVEFEARDKNPEFAGSGKEMCENFLKLQ